MSNDNRPVDQRPFEIDVTISSHKILTNLVIRHNSQEQVIEYFVDGVRVTREDFCAVMELVTLVGRSRLSPA